MFARPNGSWWSQDLFERPWRRLSLLVWRLGRAKWLFGMLRAYCRLIMMHPTESLGVGEWLEWWSRGQPDRRGRLSKMSLPLRLRMMKAHIDPILTTFCRSCAWTKSQLKTVKRVQAYALRRAFGVDRYTMQDHHLSDKLLLKAVEWEPIEGDVRRRACWKWLGHVARMRLPALPKMALWSWPSFSQAGSGRRFQGTWLSHTLQGTALPPHDWLQLATAHSGQ